MSLKSRWKARESKIGEILKSWVAKFFLAVAAIGGFTDVIGALPHDWIPQWVKVLIVICALVSYVAGKLTVKQDPPTGA